MDKLDNALREGHYARKQLMSRSRIISWSHTRRFQIGLDLGQQFAGKRVLDYGSGDGTFLALLLATPSAPAMATGSELQKDTVEECNARLGNSKLHFIQVDELDQAGPFDAIFCMEVLEHVCEPDTILQLLEKKLAPGGKLLISVPVEIGPPVLFKQTMRTVAGWLHIGDYPGIHAYNFRELVASVFAGSRQHIERPTNQTELGLVFPDHKGFNWRRFREILKERFDIETIIGSPLTWLPLAVGSQVWFVLAKKTRPADSLKAARHSPA
jgi:SAM-dependent methyltransferase